MILTFPMQIRVSKDDLNFKMVSGMGHWTPIRFVINPPPPFYWGNMSSVFQSIMSMVLIIHLLQDICGKK